MIRFTLGLALFCLTLILGGYMYLNNKGLYTAKEAGLIAAQNQRDEAKNLQTKIRNIRKLSLVKGDDQKLTLERMLDIGSPGLQLQFVGQAKSAGNQGLLRHTFRINGPATFGESQTVLQRMATLPGFNVYKYCYACSRPPKGTPANRKMVDIEGYLYVYDPNTFY